MGWDFLWLREGTFFFRCVERASVRRRSSSIVYWMGQVGAWTERGGRGGEGGGWGEFGIRGERGEIEDGGDWVQVLLLGIRIIYSIRREALQYSVLHKWTMRARETNELGETDIRLPRGSNDEVTKWWERRIETLVVKLDDRWTWQWYAKREYRIHLQYSEDQSSRMGEIRAKVACDSPMMSLLNTAVVQIPTSVTSLQRNPNVLSAYL